MEEFIKVQIGDEIEILSDDWDDSLYNLLNVGNRWNSVGQTVVVCDIVPHYCRYAPGNYFNMIAYKDNFGEQWFLPPIASVIQPIRTNLYYYSKSHFLKFEAKVQYFQRMGKLKGLQCSIQ